MNTGCMLVIGHVDHGKTSLVRALTGIETDRLPEEKQRGLSITNGYAHRSYPGGTLDFIDAPGHEDFIAAMVMGATGARAVLVVISAVEGMGAQTFEHLTIAGLLGISSAIIAVTKADLLCPSEQAASLERIRTALSQTPFARAPLTLCSSLTGQGLDALHISLAEMLGAPAHIPAPQGCFLPIDRVFTLSGLGTVVTGTLLGQDLCIEDAAVLHPSGRRVALRGLQVRGQPRDLIHAGERAAVNLRGVAKADIASGAVLCVGGDGAPSQCIDALIDVLPQASQPIKHNDAVRVLFGTTSAVAHVRLLGGGQGAAGRARFAQLRFNQPVIGFAGQRAVLRRLSPAQTIGGAVFLDPQSSPVRASNAARLGLLQAVHSADVPAVAQALSEAGGGVFTMAELARLLRKTAQAAGLILPETFVRIGVDLMSPQTAIETCKCDILRALTTYHERHPLHLAAPAAATAPQGWSPRLAAHVTAGLLARGDIVALGQEFALSDHDPRAQLTQTQHARLTQLEAQFQTADLAPPAVDRVVQHTDDADLVELLIGTGGLVALHNIALKQRLVFHREALSGAALRLGGAFPAPQTFTTSQAREALETTRRIIVPVLEYFDAHHITARSSDTRQMSAAFPVPPHDPV